LEGTDDGQKTPRGYPNFNSYVKNLPVLVFWTEGRTETLIRVGFPHYVPPGTPTARGLEELFSTVLERFLQPIHALHV
jgi:hypothetical protein